MQMTNEQADGFPLLDLKDSEAVVKNLVTIPLTQNQFDGLFHLFSTSGRALLLVLYC